MQNKKILPIAILTILAVVGFVFLLIRTLFYAPTDEINLPTDVANKSALVSTNTSMATTPAANPTYPKKLRIPSIGVNSKVQYVGITRKGNMSTPNNYTDVGWFKYGTVPGMKGSAVIAGHVDNGLGLGAVFSKLDQLKKGDTIFIDTNGGTTSTFIVTGTELLDYNAPAESIFKQNDDVYLKLITCAGVWTPAFGTHDKRLILTAKKV